MIFSFLFFLLFVQPDYPQIFNLDYSKATAQMDEMNVAFYETACLYNIPNQHLKAIVFPEMIRYSSISDFFETKALEILYKVKGSSYADFSIGYFQMKPSFVEALEKQILKDFRLKMVFPDLVSYDTDYEPDRRKIRLQRLKSEKWQLKYLCAFYRIFENRHTSCLSTLSEEYKLKMFATAYNSGTELSWETLEALLNRSYFPYGMEVEEDIQYNYAAVAYYYYKSIKNKRA